MNSHIDNFSSLIHLALSLITDILIIFINYTSLNLTPLFFFPLIDIKVWERVLRWLGFNYLIPPNLFTLWENWDGVSAGKKMCNGFPMIWHAVVWSIWCARNDQIFNNKTGEVDELVEEIKVLSWRWHLDRSNSPACMFYEWHWNPNDCLLR